jgi:hypothetical protein
MVMGVFMKEGDFELEISMHYQTINDERTVSAQRPFIRTCNLMLEKYSFHAISKRAYIRSTTRLTSNQPHSNGQNFERYPML